MLLSVLRREGCARLRTEDGAADLYVVLEFATDSTFRTERWSICESDMRAR